MYFTFKKFNMKIVYITINQQSVTSFDQDLSQSLGSSLIGEDSQDSPLSHNNR